MDKVAAAVLVASGLATRYSPDTMQVVVANREMYGHIEPGADVRGYVALLDREHLGRQVWLEAPNGHVIGPVMVSDCASEKDRERLTSLGFAVDLSYELAEEFGVIEMPSGKRISAVDAPIRGFRVWDRDPRPRGRLRNVR